MSTPRPLTPAQRTLRARIAAHSLHASRDSRALTAKARAHFLASFEHAVDPDLLLPTAERQRRAGHARSAYFAELAFRSSRARQGKRSDARPKGAPEGIAAAKNRQR